MSLMNFGKYRSMEMSEVLLHHPAYVQWLMDQKDFARNRPEHYEFFCQKLGITPVQPDDTNNTGDPYPDMPEYRPLDKEKAKQQLNITSDSDLNYLDILIQSILQKRHIKLKPEEPETPSDNVPF